MVEVEDEFRQELLQYGLDVECESSLICNSEGRRFLVLQTTGIPIRRNKYIIDMLRGDGYKVVMPGYPDKNGVIRHNWFYIEKIVEVRQ